MAIKIQEDKIREIALTFFSPLSSVTDIWKISTDSNNTNLSQFPKKAKLVLSHPAKQFHLNPLYTL